MSDRTIEFLKELIAVDSVNPLLVPGAAGEGAVAEAAASEMRGIGLGVEIAEAAPGRPNVVGVMEGRAAGPTLMFCGHLDTVGIEGMPAPFDPVERDGRIYGRGAQDMKGGVAAMIGAARSLVLQGGLPAGRLVIAAVSDEEYTSIGAEALVRRWKADAAVVAEPTDLAIGVGHKGFSWVEIVAHGIAAHGSRPLEGRDAIFRMGRVIPKLEALDRRLQSGTRHPIMGTASLHASLIEGGREMSTYPERCTLKVERRTIGGEDPVAAMAEVEGILAELRAEDAEFSAEARSVFGRLPYETPEDCPLPGMLESILSRNGRRPRRSGVTFWTDAAVLGHSGIPCVIFGPGGAGLHSVEEYVKTEEVLACRDALAELARRFCGPEEGR